MNKLKKTTAKHLSFLQMMDKLSALLFTENYHLSDEAYRTVKRITKHLNQLIERHEQDLRDNKMRKQEQTTCKCYINNTRVFSTLTESKDSIL